MINFLIRGVSWGGSGQQESAAYFLQLLDTFGIRAANLPIVRDFVYDHGVSVCSGSCCTWLAGDACVVAGDVTPRCCNSM